jgi:hypothetical protein
MTLPEQIQSDWFNGSSGSRFTGSVSLSVATLSRNEILVCSILAVQPCKIRISRSLSGNWFHVSTLSPPNYAEEGTRTPKDCSTRS